jgi:hypothetical protein
MSVLNKVYEFEPLDLDDIKERVLEVGELEYDSYVIDLDRFDIDTFSIMME